MTYHLYIGDYAYSSWSLRGWLLFDAFGIAVKSTRVDFAKADVVVQLAATKIARTVPTLVTPEGAIVSESLAIAEELASRHPEAGIWPAEPKDRATARTLAAEMATSFGALRSACPMNLRLAYDGFDVSNEVRKDLDRIETIWHSARQSTGATGPWLCGPYSAADVFYAPVAARIATYGLPVGPEAQAYVAAHLAHPSFLKWRAWGLEIGETLPWYAQDLPEAPWPGPDQG